jgi:magnesium chelatase subunit D
MIASARGVPDLITLLAATAAEPALDAVLLLDLPPDALASVANIFAELLRTEPRFLGAHLTDDDLWTGVGLRDERTFGPVPGLLVEQPSLLVVVDLARAGLPLARSMVELAGAPVGTVARHGVDRVWRPRARWLATCASAEAGQISLHLLERFTVRFPAARAFPAGDLVARLAGGTGYPTRPSVPPRWRPALSGIFPSPTVEESAVEAAVRLHPDGSARRPISLVRLARGLARLDGAEVVTAQHVEFAATLTGLIDPTYGDGPAPASAALPDAAEPAGQAPQALPATAGAPAAAGAGPAVKGTPVAAEPALPLGAEPVRAGRPYPEDTAEPDREAAPLRLPWQRRRGRVTTAGAVIGTRPATDATDIAWVPTVLAAARMQPLRRRQRPDRTGFQLGAADLRSYRRTPEPEHLLGLVLDHTCRSGWDWLPALASFLQWAYVRRATVLLVQIGGATARTALRAEQARLRSVLDARVMAALTARPGSATPLAHGLELAHASLRHSLQHGRAPVTEAVLVVVTDALGNVPLGASLADRVDGPVADEGVRDAVTAAEGLRALDNLRVVCVQPPGRPYPQLLGRLAQALGAAVVPAGSALRTSA